MIREDQYAAIPGGAFSGTEVDRGMIPLDRLAKSSELADFVRLPLPLIRQAATLPEPGKTSYRKRPSWLMPRSRGVEPWLAGGSGGSVVPSDVLEERQAPVVADAVTRDRARRVVGTVGELAVVLEPARVELGIGGDFRDR